MRKSSRCGGYISKVELEQYDLLATQGEHKRAISALQCRIHEQAAAMYSAPQMLKSIKKQIKKVTFVLIFKHW